MTEFESRSRPWPEIVAYYERFTGSDWGDAMYRLVTQLDTVGFVDAGLHGATGMITDLVLGASSTLWVNPRLRIHPHGKKMDMKFEDGSVPPWSISVEFEELYPRVERLLVKRLRWFRLHNSAQTDQITTPSNELNQQIE